ncbi:MAG: gfo/Idh/MocA family oxidoreductase [Calditrichaeota bacterium]|nr:MAG: gfo/Idh/MocA family oxidoreductase [Calditrichota bacterium]MBL1204339.1 gfo/Idh/MocA family oxidoreductase [Calditrichota bacterium]NOG44168.1 Gfo/Idh/MocA family oxidoreductase [Calditrichota bacterium]
MNKNKTLKWGIIGAGIIGHKMAEALNINPDCHLHAVASKSATKAKQFADEHNIENACTYQEIVSDNEIDIIYVATTHNFHYENTKLALEHGKHVLVEKAFTVNAKEAKELVGLARKNNLFLMEAMWTRFLPSLRNLKNVIQNHEIGEVKNLNISFGGFVGPEYEKRLTEPDLAGGVTLDMGIYPISVVCFLLGELPTEIKSMTRFSDLGVDEISNYMFRFPSGCFANISTSYNLKMRNQAEIYGSRGYIEFPEFHKGDRFTIFEHDGTNEIKDVKKVVENNHENGFIYQVEEVVNCINNGKQESDIIPLDETVAIMEIMDKMRDEWGFKYPFE